MSGKSNVSTGRLLMGLCWVIAILTCTRVWLAPAGFVSTAHAQIPDSGLQRRLLLEEARRTNQLLSEIKDILSSGTLNVRLQSADNKNTDN